jgi:transposase-like protein
LDGTNFRFHEHSPAEPVLCAWGIDTNGKPHLVDLAAASSESTDAWVDFLEGLVTRKLTSPLLVVSDGAPAIEQVFPKALRQRCAIHYEERRIMWTAGDFFDGLAAPLVA